MVIPARGGKLTRLGSQLVNDSENKMEPEIAQNTLATKIRIFLLQLVYIRVSKTTVNIQISTLMMKALRLKAMT
jgi:hypothetical protein